MRANFSLHTLHFLLQKTKGNTRKSMMFVADFAIPYHFWGGLHIVKHNKNEIQFCNFYFELWFLCRYVCTNFVQVSVEEEFFDLPKDTILSLLASEDLRVDSEYQVFLAAMNWLYHNVGSRRR